jgi:hypothetical protein
MEWWSDSDWANYDDRKSVTGYLGFLAGGPVAWRSTKQKIVALSSCEAEFIALAECIKEVLWWIQLFKELRIDLPPPVVYVDNQSAIALAKNPVAHNRTKHIDIRYYFLRQHVMEGHIRLVYVPTLENLADIFTKGVSRQIFGTLVRRLVKRS